MSDAEAIHISSDDEHIVGIGNLRVVILEENEFWYAQGIEIDYLAQGDSLEDVQKSFEIGLGATIRENLKKHESIWPMLRWAPADVLEHILPATHSFDQVSIHEIEKPEEAVFPFGGIQFLCQKTT